MPTEMIEMQRLLSGEAFTEDILETVQLLGGFLIEHFPNPGRVSVDDAAVTINGEELELKQVHIELNGGGSCLVWSRHSWKTWRKMKKA